MINKFYLGDVLDCLRMLPDESVNCVVTSPPYWGLRDYGVSGQIGLEPTPTEYVEKMVTVFWEVWRVLRADGTLWLNLGDCYAASSNTGGTKSIQGQPKRIGSMTSKAHKIPDGLKPKDLCGVPWLVAFALQADGWYLRSDIIWAKPNPMPESVTDRPTKAHEYLFLLSKSEKYYYDHETIKEEAISKERFHGGYDKTGVINKTAARNGRKQDSDNSISKRNKRSVWEIPTEPFPGSHFATFPRALVEPCILAGSPKGGTVLDPFGGSGTVALVASSLGRNSIYIDLNPEYLEMAIERNGFNGLCHADEYEILRA